MFGQRLWDLFRAYNLKYLNIDIDKYSEEEKSTIAVVLGIFGGFLSDVPEARQLYGVELLPELKELKEGVRLDGNGLTIKELQKQVHENAINKGWWDSDLPRTFGDQIALFHTEVSEAMLDYQNNKEINEIYYEGNKPCGIPIELADVLIRIMDTCEYYGIDLENVLVRKMKYNEMRPYRHGGKRL